MMVMQNKKNQRIISFLLIILVFAPVVLFSEPKQAKAVTAPCPPSKSAGTFVLVQDIITQGSTSASCSKDLKEWAQKLLDMTKQRIAAKVLERVTQSIINWINNGFHGSPLFLENPDSFFKDIAKFEVKSFVDMFGYDRLRFPFGRDFALNTINNYKSTLEGNLSYSLSGVMSQQEAENFRNDFSVGGWNAFFINTQYPQNNYIGFQMMANEALARQLAGTNQAPAEKIQKELDRGQGFLSPQKCMDNNGNNAYNNMYNQFNRPSFDYAGYTSSHPLPPIDDEDAQIAWSNAQIAAIDEWATTNTCKNLVNTTPGSVVADQVMMSLSSHIRSKELAQAIGNSLSVIFDALLNKFMGDGLNALADLTNPQPTPVDHWSYDGQTLDGGGYNPVPENLIIPQNVSIHVGQTTSKNISGGTAPYSIEIPSDTAIANAQISGATLAITGIASGETTVTVKDSSFPTKRATVRITVAGIGDLMVIPANIVANENDPVSAAISGGSTPYSLLTNPDQTVAIALIDDTTLLVTGVTPGQTSVVIKDSSSTPKIVTVNITIIGSQADNPTVTLTANPIRIRPGQSSTLSWTSTNVTSCSSSSLGLRTVPINGETTVSPTSTTTYDITCYDRSGQDIADSVMVAVANNP